MTEPSTAIRAAFDVGEATKKINQGWSELPNELLHTILTCLCSVVDFISFSSVCRSWRAVASSLSSSQTTSLFPPLLLCPTFSRSQPIFSLHLLDPTSPSFSRSLTRSSNELSSLSVVSYSHGHLLRLSENHVVILNPFTGVELCSPRLPEDHNSFCPSLLLTSPLPSPDSGILAFASSSLFYWHIGSTSWSCHYCPRNISFDGMIVVTVKGNVYAMDTLDTLYVLDLSPNLHLRPLAIVGTAVRSFNIWYSLVDCGGELLRLQLVVTNEVNSGQLEAFSLESNMRWVKKETLENWAIFVGCKRRVPGIAVKNPERWGGRSNCVYFATRNADGDSLWAVIKLGDRIDVMDPESPMFIGKFNRQLSSVWVPLGF